MQYLIIGMLFIMGVIKQAQAQVDVGQLSVYKVAEHEYINYEAAGGVSKIAGNTLFREGREGNTLYHVDNHGITFKRQYPKSYFVEPTNIIVEYELSDDGKKLLSIDKANEIAKIWQINTDFSLELLSEIGFNKPPEEMRFVDEAFQDGHYILYGQRDDGTFVRTVFAWDQANNRFSQHSRLTFNNANPSHELAFHNYPEQGLMVAISPKSLYLYQEGAQEFELKQELAFEFVSHDRIATQLDTINNRLLVHYWSETIMLELNENNSVTAATSSPHESLFGLNIGVDDLHPTAERLIAQDMSCLYTLNLNDANTYTATELVCNPVVRDISDISADGSKLLMPSRDINVVDISNINDIKQLTRPREQGRIKAPSNSHVNLPLGEHSSLNYNGALLTHSHLTPEHGQTFVSDSPLESPLTPECRYQCKAWLNLGKEVVALHNDQFTRYSVSGEEQTLSTLSGTLTLSNSGSLGIWFKAIALNETEFMLTDGNSLSVFTKTQTGFAHKFTQNIDIEFSYYGYTDADFLYQNNQLHLFDRDNKQLVRYNYTGDELAYDTAIPFGPLDSGDIFDRNLATYMLNDRLIVETQRGYQYIRAIKIFRIENNSLIEEASLPGTLLASPHAVSAQQMVLLTDQGDDKIFVFDSSVDDSLIELGDYNGYKGSYTPKGQLLHFYGQGSVFVSKILQPITDTLNITTLQGVKAEFDLNELFNASLHGKLTFSAENLPAGLTLSAQGLMRFDGTVTYDTNITVNVLDGHQRTATFSVHNTYMPGPEPKGSLVIEMTQNESYTVDLKTLVADALAVTVNHAEGDMTLSGSTITITFYEPGIYQLPFSAVNVYGAIATHMLKFDVSKQTDNSNSDSKKEPDVGAQDNSNGGDTETTTSGNTSSNTGNIKSTTSTSNTAKNDGGSGGSMAWLLMAMALLLPTRSRFRQVR
ncbi:MULTISPECIES: hypothetical protein [unclassified Pseudoalteromonas]|uniref:hypothetical protein n=1 Tax=unclassified Pseudoalteromonas TaxID=194690 RepID=UPI00209783CC|nr:hypothetical protein [Pseudoalteromonas sp. XMcav2-N]MCO7190808.1 hypothetical protein [Pseudoalteromonas sp. XMcav2-N]